MAKQLGWICSFLLLWAPPACWAATAPPWMHALVNAPLPPHDEKTDAVLLYQDISVAVQPNGKIKEQLRLAFKILRPEGNSYGAYRFYWDPTSPISDLRGWCIPGSGKDYEVKDRDAVDMAVNNTGGEAVTDTRLKVLRIPEAVPGSIVGYEVQRELRPYQRLDEWDFQDEIPVRESHFSLQLPSTWKYRETFVNHAPIPANASGSNQWTWEIHDVPAVHMEPHMPPLDAVAAKMVVIFEPPGPAADNIETWDDLGVWVGKLTAGRRDASNAIKDKVHDLTDPIESPFAKMQALAGFVQNQIRYVAITLGIGGYQPHPSQQVFEHRYGDCKDNVTLLSSMLSVIGVRSYYVVINTDRGAIGTSTPPNLGFDHMIMAIALPAGVNDPQIKATIEHPKLGRLLFFDPTNSVTPLGTLPGYLQANYGLLVRDDGGELVQLPQLPPLANGVARSAHMTLDLNGKLQGEVKELRVGGRAAQQRYVMRETTADADKIKVVEDLAALSLSNFQIVKAAVRNAKAPEFPFEWQYTIEADKFAKMAGDLVLVRPRLLGIESQGFLESKEKRVNSIEFEEPERDTDEIDITIPGGFVVDELPSALDIDKPYASYHSKTDFKNGVLHYSRVFELKQLELPADKAVELRDFYREITNDERNSAVFKRGSP